MITSLPPRSVSVLLTTLLLLVLPASVAASQPDSNAKAPTTHTITISYDVHANPQWDYTIVPANDAKKARVKKGDVIHWICSNGNWTVFFKGATPLVDGAGNPLPQVNGASGGTAGADVSKKVKKDDVFAYGVSVILPGGGAPVVDDPEIIIED
ncbi:MAG: hypothetical protein PSU94_16225 [Lacunisphaera sp.]|nr:hypothetical protein [Lacunisphaera sp.]